MGTEEGGEARWSQEAAGLLAGRKGADENVRALEGIGFLPPPAALSCLCCFPERPNYNPLVEPGLPEIPQR